MPQEVLAHRGRAPFSMQQASVAVGRDRSRKKKVTMKIDVFLADCPLCRQTLRALHEAAPPTAQVTLHRCRGPCCCKAGRRYDLYAVLPAVVLNGRVVRQGRLTPNTAKRLFDSAAQEATKAKPLTTRNPLTESER